MDVRTGGTYRFVFQSAPEPMAFFGRYLEVIPNARLAWTNEEGGDAGSVTTVTFEERDGKTTVVVSELYPSKEALEADGAHEAATETHAQLDELLARLTATAGHDDAKNAIREACDPCLPVVAGRPRAVSAGR